MYWYQTALAGAAITALVLSSNLRRAWLWIGLGALSFASSSWWHDAGYPHATVFGASTNLAICFLMYAFARRRWEMRVWNCFHLMIVIDLLYLWGWIGSHWWFAVGLEAANWLALIITASAGLLDMVADHEDTAGARRTGWVHRLSYALHAKRSDTPFGQRP